MAITRVTYFKIAKAADMQKLIPMYRAMPTKALKVSPPRVRQVGSAGGPILFCLFSVSVVFGR